MGQCPVSGTLTIEPETGGRAVCSSAFMRAVGRSERPASRRNYEPPKSLRTRCSLSRAHTRSQITPHLFLTAAVLLPAVFWPCDRLSAEPLAAELADDTVTRGNWLRRYGSLFYLLCGMESPKSVCHTVLTEVRIKTRSGNPKDTGRSWRSAGRAKDDGRVLIHPRTRERVPACWDDHGEEYGPGEGPDLYIDFTLPIGRLVLSMYFFEIDWIQYRANVIELTDARSSKLLCKTRVDNFFDGKYKRFEVLGPGTVTIRLAREDCANAVISGLFLDSLEPPRPDLIAPLFGTMLEGSALEPEIVRGAERAAATVSDLAPRLDGEPLADELLAAQWQLVQWIALARDYAPKQYYEKLHHHWRELMESAGRLMAIEDDPSLQLKACGLRLYAALRLLDSHTAHSAFGQLLDRATSVPLNTGHSRMLSEMHKLLMARPFDDYERSTYAERLDSLIATLEPRPRDALLRATLTQYITGGLPKAAIQCCESAVARQPDRIGPVTQTLWANAQLLLGQYEEATARYRKAIRRLPEGEDRDQAIANLIACQAELGEYRQALAWCDRVSKAQRADAYCQLGVTLYERGERESAKDVFLKLRKVAEPGYYREEAAKYLRAIKRELRAP